MYWTYKQSIGNISKERMKTYEPKGVVWGTSLGKLGPILDDFVSHEVVRLVSDILEGVGLRKLFGSCRKQRFSRKT